MNRWITNNWSKLENLKLSEIYLPGTHNSFCYTVSFDKKTELYKNLDLVYNIAGYFPEITQNFTLNQDLSVYDQLNIGTRILDLRISYYDNIYYCSHTYYCTTLIDILTQINNFMLENPNEFIIIRYKEDQKHKDQRHKDQKHKDQKQFNINHLNEYLDTVLGSKINQKSIRLDGYLYENDKTLKEMFYGPENGHLLLFYNNNGLATDWYNTPDLKSFTEIYESKQSVVNADSADSADNNLVVLDVVLTPSFDYIIKLIVFTLIFCLVVFILFFVYIRNHITFGLDVSSFSDFRYSEIILGSIILFAVSFYYFIVMLIRHYSLKYSADKVNNLIMAELDSNINGYKLFSFDFINKEIAKKVIDKNFE